MVKTYIKALAADIREIGTTFAEGDIKTRLSFLIFGIGPLLRGKVVKGLAYLAVQIALVWYFVSVGWGYLSKISTLIVLCVSYALSRTRFPGRELLMRFWLILGMFPGFLTMICLYFMPPSLSRCSLCGCRITTSRALREAL